MILLNVWGPKIFKYALEHHIGHIFLQPELALDQLSIDVYNGTGELKDVAVDCKVKAKLVRGVVNISVLWMVRH